MIDTMINRKAWIHRKTCFFIPFVLATFLGGCSTLFGDDGWFPDRSSDYLKSEVLPGINLPDGVKSEAIQPMYVIPEINDGQYDYTQEFETPRPLPLSSNAYSEKVKIQKLSGKRWILISTPPSQAWPRVRNFLGRVGMQVAYTDAQNGIIETSWVQFKDDPDHKDRYRLRIEQGVQPDSTEIHTLHLSVANELVDTEQVQWPVVSVNVERETWLVDELANSLASQSGGSATSLLAQTIGGGPKVEMLTRQAELVLRMDLDFTRAWATVSHAVKQEGFHLFDQDTDVGAFYVDYRQVSEEDGEPGFFTRMFSFGGDDGELSTPYSLIQLVDHMPLDDTPANRAIFPQLTTNPGKRLENVPGYLVILVRDQGSVEVRIRDGYGQKISQSHAKDLLGVLRRNLI